MQHCDTLDESRQHLRLALEYIGKYRLSANPHNYCLWYELCISSGKTSL